MIHSMTRRLLILAGLLLSMTATADTPLTDELIDQYMVSLKQMAPLTERISNEDTQGATTLAKLWMKGDTNEITSHLKSRPYYDELNEVVQESGFDNTAAWVQAAQRITNAYMALELGGKGAETAAQIEASLQQLRDNQYLNEAQKEELIQQLKNSQARLANLKEVSAADQAAVKPHLDELRRHFEESAGER